MTDEVTGEQNNIEEALEPEPTAPYQLTIKRGFAAFAIMLGSQILGGFILAFIPSFMAGLEGREP